MSGLPTLSEAQNWDVSHLESAATRWRAAADQHEQTAQQHLTNVTNPAGTEWRGTFHTAMVDSATDLHGRSRAQADIIREAATIASSGAQDVRGAQRSFLDAVADAQQDQFRVNPDLSVADTKSQKEQTAARQQLGQQHADYIRWRAMQLVAADDQVTQKITAKTGELHGHRGAEVQAVDNTTPTPKPAEPPAEVRTGDDVRARLGRLPAGKNEPVVTMPTEAAIRDEFGTLTKNAQKIDDPNYPRGDRYQLPDGTKIGLREGSKFGGPSIDVTYPDKSEHNVHMPWRKGGGVTPPSAVPAQESPATRGGVPGGGAEVIPRQQEPSKPGGFVGGPGDDPAIPKQLHHLPDEHYTHIPGMMDDA